EEIRYPELAIAAIAKNRISKEIGLLRSKNLAKPAYKKIYKYLA
ncbi:10044_t:CDS:1, partial [Cetraspora pellucida]